MTGMLLAWVAFPLVMGVLSFGCGLLLEHASGMALPGGLLLPAGFAVICVATQFAHLTDQTAGLQTPAVVGLATVGFGLAFPWQRRSVDRWLVTAAVGVYAVFAAPVVLSGRATFLGYIKLDDTANYMALLDRAMDHAYNITGLAASTYEALLSAINLDGYPLGALSPLGVGSELMGRDALWLWQPYLAFLAALTALTLYALVSRVIASRPLRAIVVVAGAQAALLYGYALWGGIKELPTALLVILIALLVPATMSRERARAVLPLAVASAAVLHVLSLAGVVWLAPPLTGALLLGLRSGGIRRTVRMSAAFVLAASVLLIPAFAAATRLFSGPRNFTDSGGYENLVQRLNWLQVFGVWPNGDFRRPPVSLDVTYVLVAAVAVSAAIALVLAWRRGAWELLLAGVTATFACVVYVSQGSPWIGSKALASSSPIVLTVALVGSAMLFELGRRVEAGVLAGFMIAGVLWSNALQYHEVWLAPSARLAELESIGKRHPRQGPTLLGEFEPYGTRHFLREMDAESPSELRRHFIYLRDGSYLSGDETGVSLDIDEIRLQDVLFYRTLVLRRSGLASRPPSGYSLISSRRYYQVWQRGGLPSPVLEHLSLGSRLQPAAVPPCREILRLGRLAAASNGLLAAVQRPRAIVLASDGTVAPIRFGRYGEDTGALYPLRAASVEASFTAPTGGVYGIWIGGSFRSRVDVSIDGRQLGNARNVLQWPTNFVQLGTAQLEQGRHTFRLSYAGPERLRPGSGGQPPFGLGPFAIAKGTQDRPITHVEPSDARTLCGKSLDWVEALRG